ncbi:hypothetical protein DOK78_001522 [Enterococcus sp. DIV2402]|uniref:Uncharacterized protein n=1 Tax=Candidatus Enterococcus lowellii TaxID=2230877 RepID=A0ABZ2SMN2_9ENTE|nr:XcbB/CpsF family capsular polysaccharide biosynthesis protein [Enterococcus sp. DIV2402]MBO0464289.1 XcbB/CpsF family capsular polysaccharide biosynthesis protein [Enterococcus sp. DIV2402]
MAKVIKKKREANSEVLDDIVYINLDEYEGNYSSKKLGIRVGPGKNILELADEDEDVYLFYQKLLTEDYMFYWHHNGVSYFIRRKYLKEIWKRTDLGDLGGLFYTVEEPLKERSSETEKNNLIVIFSPMPAENVKYSSNISARCFRTYFPNIQKYLAKNTYVLRIMDANLSYGSLYLNTSNYPNMEEDVQNIIQKIQEELNIEKERVVLYGVDNIAMSALHHGIKGDFKSVIINPYFTLEELKESSFYDKYLSNALPNDLKELVKNAKIENHLIIDSKDSGHSLEELNELARVYMLNDSVDREELVKHVTIETSLALNKNWINI